jgi:enamine deaminase RidA (YjgF/YER057c/UK114 family)
MRHLECNSSEAAPLTAVQEDASNMGDEIVALRAQMRVLRAIALGSLAISAVVLAVLANNALIGQETQSRRSANHLTHVADLSASTQLSSARDDNVIVPYGFKSCDSSSMPPQIAPIRHNGDFLFLSGILGYDKPCKTAHKDVEKQITAAFNWANETLKAAGVEWRDVLTVTSYHVELHQHQDIFSRMREQVLPKPPYPAWTAVGVKSLYFPDEIFEMTIIARKEPCMGLECDR